MEKILIDSMTVNERLQRAAWMVENDERRKRWSFLTDKKTQTRPKGLNDHQRRVLEVMLENQLIQGQVLGQMFQERRRGVMERTLSTDIASFITNSLPVLRCVFDELCDDFYSIQPITQDSAYAFWLDYQYEDSHMYSKDTSLCCGHTDPNYGIVPEKGDVRGIKLSLVSELVHATLRKLLHDWSFEADMKLRSQFGISADSELLVASAKEHAREINVDILLDMVASAGAGNVNWNWTTPAVAPWTALDPKVYGKTLYDAICDASLLVWDASCRYPNRLIMDGATFNRLRKLEMFRLYQGDDRVKRVGIEYVGTLDEQYLVCVAKSFPANTILVFYQGDTWDETGYVYMPYVTFWSSDLWFDARDFDNYRGTVSWAARKMVRPGMFATVSLMP